MRLVPLTIAMMLIVSSLIAAEPASVRVMSFNIRYDNPNDGANAWKHRQDWVGNLIAEQNLDVVGLQEVVASQLDDLKERLTGMTAYGVGREDGEQKGEFCPIFFRNDRWQQIDQGTFWLSPSPDQAGSRGWDAALPRIASWLKLQEQDTSAVLVVVNTHFDHRGEKAREESAKLLIQCLQQDFADFPIVLTGDFNTLPQSAPYELLVGKIPPAVKDGVPLTEKTVPVFRDSYLHGATPPTGPDSTWNGFNAIVPGQRIDFIFVTDAWKVRQVKILTDQRKGRFPSDHLPVIAALEWLPKR